MNTGKPKFPLQTSTEIPGETRVCSKCPERGPQPMANFHKNKGSVGGRLKYCKECVRKDNAEKKEARKLYTGF